jgi:hypothetical protein
MRRNGAGSTLKSLVTVEGPRDPGIRAEACQAFVEGSSSGLRGRCHHSLTYRSHTTSFGVLFSVLVACDVLKN